MLSSGQNSFAADVIEASKHKPVLVDFWAPWCGPCRMLGPVLEKLEQEYGGKWTLAKVNTDEEQSLAAQFQISGIPHCVMFVDGRAVDSFTGVLPEPKLREFLDQYIADESRVAVAELAKTDAVAAARQILGENLSGAAIESLLWSLLPSLVADTELFQAALNRLPEAGSPFSDAVITLKEFTDRHSKDGVEALSESLETVAAIFDEAKAKPMMQSLLDRMETDKEHRDEHKADLVFFFRVLGQNHPLVAEFRPKLARILY